MPENKKYKVRQCSQEIVNFAFLFSSFYRYHVLLMDKF